jgi:hypothetical protein
MFQTAVKCVLHYNVFQFLRAFPRNPRGYIRPITLNLPTKTIFLICSWVNVTAPAQLQIASMKLKTLY